MFFQQPPRYVTKGESNNGGLLKKSIYGLKQPPRFDKFNSILLQVFIEQVSNHAMFVKSPSTGYVIIIVYVDDIVIVGSNVSGINETKKWLHSQLHIKDLGKLQNFLGIVMSRNKHGLLLSQQ